MHGVCALRALVEVCFYICRYSSEAFSGVSQISLMSYKELKEQLGWDQSMCSILFTPPVSAKSRNGASKHKKRLSFLSDSQYLTSPPTDLNSDDELYDDEDESHSHPSPRQSDPGSTSSSLSASLSDSHLGDTDRDQDFAVLVSPPGCGIHPLSPSGLSRCSSQSLIINPNGSGFPQPVFNCDDENDEETDEEDNAGLPSLNFALPSSKTSSSNSASSLYESTTINEVHLLEVRGSDMAVSGCTTSVACGSSEAALSIVVDEDSRSLMDTFSTASVDNQLHQSTSYSSASATYASNDAPVLAIVQEDSRSIMDTIPPPNPASAPSSPTDELTSFVSSLPLPTPSFAGVLERDAENTPFELDPTANHSMAAAVKQSLHFGSCDTKMTRPHVHAYARVHPKPRVPLQPVDNFVREPLGGVFSKDNDRQVGVKTKAVDGQRLRRSMNSN